MSESLEARVAALEASVAERDQRNEELEARVHELEDIRAVIDVQRKWDNICTGGFNGLSTHRMEQALQLLTDDATIEFQGSHDRGKGARGMEALVAHFGSLHRVLPLACQLTSDYHVEVDGDVALQNADCFGLIEGNATGGKPTLNFVRYTTQLVRTPEGWKIRQLIITAGLSTTLPEPMRASEVRPGSGWAIRDWLEFPDMG